MRYRTLAMAAGLVAALAASASSAPAAPETARASQFVTPLSVSMSCHIDGQTCEATASGGSGEYSFEWSSLFVEQYDADGVSGGDVGCYPYWGWRTISVTVTDSWNGTSTASQYFFCPA
jgi:hypothetical protein